MMLHRFSLLLLTLCLALGAPALGQDSPDAPADDQPAEQSPTTEDDPTAEDDTPADDETASEDDALALDATEQSSTEVTVTATRAETPVSELTRSVTVLSREQIRQQSTIDRNLGDILGKTVPGFSPSTEGLTDFGQTVRGRNFLVLIDGVPISAPLRDGERDLNTLDPDAIERLEIVRGGTAAFGFGATGGLVNMITRKPADDVPIEGYSEAGFGFSTEHPDSSLQWHTTQRVSGKIDEFDYLVSGTFVDRHGFFDSDGDRIPPDPHGVQGGFADSDQWNALGKFGLDFDQETQRVELMVNHFDFEQDTEWTFGTGDPANGEKTPAVQGNLNDENPINRNTTISGRYEHNDIFRGTSMDLQAYYGDFIARYSKFPGFDQTEIRSEKVGTRLTFNTPFMLTEDTSIRAIWGLDFLHDDTVQQSVDGSSRVPLSQDALAGFGELEVPVGEIGLIRGGVRHEAFWLDVDDVEDNSQGVDVDGAELSFDATLFNATAVGYLTEEIDIFGGFSQGFSVADFGRAVSDTTETDARALESEVQKVDNYELGLRGDWGRFRGSVAGFFSKSNNGRTFDTDLRIAQQPERIWGVEADADFQLHDQWTVGGTATWLEGEVDLDADGNYEEDLPGTRIPPVKLTGYVEYEPTPWWTNRLQAMYSGDRTPDSTQFGGQEVDDYVLVDFYTSFDIGRGNLRVGVKNLLNEDYFPMINQATAASYNYTMGSGRTLSFIYSVNW